LISINHELLCAGECHFLEKKICYLVRCDRKA
jgi:hypothetical protein